MLWPHLAEVHRRRSRYFLPPILSATSLLDVSLAGSPITPEIAMSVAINTKPALPREGQIPLTLFFLCPFINIATCKSLVKVSPSRGYQSAKRT